MAIQWYLRSVQLGLKMCRCATHFSLEAHCSCYMFVATLSNPVNQGSPFNCCRTASRWQLSHQKVSRQIWFACSRTPPRMAWCSHAWCCTFPEVAIGGHTYNILQYRHYESRYRSVASSLNFPSCDVNVFSHASRACTHSPESCSNAPQPLWVFVAASKLTSTVNKRSKLTEQFHLWRRSPTIAWRRFRSIGACSSPCVGSMQFCWSGRSSRCWDGISATTSTIPTSTFVPKLRDHRVSLMCSQKGVL